MLIKEIVSWQLIEILEISGGNYSSPGKCTSILAHCNAYMQRSRPLTRLARRFSPNSRALSSLTFRRRQKDPSSSSLAACTLELSLPMLYRPVHAT